MRLTMPTIPNSSGAEVALMTLWQVDILSNGFKIRTTGSGFQW
jgi:hypothetical protein